LIFVSDPISVSRMACQAVKIEQDFRETVEWSLCLRYSFLCISNSYFLLPSQNQFKCHLSVPFYWLPETRVICW
jgi:hypothetical protein